MWQGQYTLKKYMYCNINHSYFLRDFLGGLLLKVILSLFIKGKKENGEKNLKNRNRKRKRKRKRTSNKKWSAQTGSRSKIFYQRILGVEYVD